MPRKPGRVPADNTRESYIYRAASFDVSDARDSDRSIPMILATENPIPAYDVSRMDVVDEILHFEGMDIPAKVTMVDSHQKDTVRNVLGSIRELKVDDGKLIGRAYFAANPDAEEVYRNYRDGHLTDFSIGAAPLQVRYEGRNEKHVLRSILREGSAVVAGQDPGAKSLPFSMRAYVDPQALKEEAVDKAVRDTLIGKGLSEEATDAEALDFLNSLTSTVDEQEVTTVATSDELAEEEKPVETPVSEPAAEIAENEEPEMAATQDPAALVAAERKRINDITDICRGHCDNKETRTYIDSGKTPQEVAYEIINRKHKDVVADTPTEAPARIEGGVSEREKFYAAAENGMLQRMADSGQVNPAAVLERSADRHAIQRSTQIKKALDNPAAGADEFRFTRLPDLARMFLERSGERVFGLSQPEIVRRAMAQQKFIERSDQATNTTGTFSNLLLDAANKTLLAGYDEAEYTYSMWVRQAPSAADFKTLNRIRFGELADPEVIPENDPYKEKGTSDAKESYGVEKYGEIFSISFEAVVNDDLNAMTRIPQMQGAAMRRKVNKVCYSVLTANAALSDGVTLFHASSHGANLDGTALSEAALDTGFAVMMTQSGLSGSGTPLAIRPSYLLVPAALAATAHRLVGGNVVPTAAGTNVPLYGAGRSRPLMVVEEPQLDLNSATAWYLAASSNQVDTVEVTFLQGEESPVLSREEGFTTDTLKYKIRQTFAAKAIDYRGLYQGNS